MSRLATRRSVRDLGAGVRVIVAALAALLAQTCVARGAEIRFHGLLDLVATQRGPAFEQNLLTHGDARFDPATLRLFADGTINPRTQVFAQLVMNDASNTYLEGAYVMFTPWPALDLHATAGKIPWLVGTWAPRSYSNENPLVGVPLLYSHATSLLWSALPSGPDGLLAAAGSGIYGVGYGGSARPRGMPMVDDSYWDLGAAILGSARPLEFAVGVTQGTPGWASVGEDDNPGKSIQGRLGLAPLPGLRVGVSGAIGPYLGAWLQPALPAGRTIGDYRQKLGMADLELLTGRLELRAEGARSAWETPNLGTLSVTGGYVETKLLSPWGAFAAARYDLLRFGNLASASGGRRPWDDDVDRVEAGLGYRFTRDVTAKLVYQRTVLDRSGAGDAYPYQLVAGQLSVGF